ncbi:MAG: cytochrome c biogenesis protein [Archaeoglobaceae archaeon]
MDLEDEYYDKLYIPSLKIKYMRWNIAPLSLMLLALVLVIVGSYNALIVLPEAEGHGNVYRIVFFHVPAAVTAFLAFTVTLISSIQYLRKRSYNWDIISLSSAKAGFFLITAALISGSIWANVAWGTYWNWDPRETTILVLWFAYAAYFTLRASIESLEEKAKTSSILAIFAYATIPITYLSTRLYASLHPQQASFGEDIGATLGMMIIGFILAYLAYLILDTKLNSLELKVREVE